MEAAGRFTDHAAAYDAGRPAYPSEAIDLVFAGFGEPARLRVADLGAGTGISARMLGERGAQVFAVEPNAAMRARAGELRYVTWVDGTAERTGLPNAGVDIVTAFQAFHWFERPAVFAEIGRITRPAGRAVAVYYERDEDDPFTASYGTLIRQFATDQTELRRAEALAAFEQWYGWKSVARTDLRGEHLLGPEAFYQRIRSTSYLPQSGAEHESFLEKANALYAAHEMEGRVRMRLVTTIVVAQLP
jgi:SAM-dependent methyltransferase